MNSAYIIGRKGKYISFKIEELLDKRMYAYFMTSFSLKAYIKKKYQACLMEKTLVVERELEKRNFLPGTINTIMTGRLYAALQMVDPETIDVTEWLEYFTDGVAASMKTVKEKVLGLSKDVKVLK